MTEQEFRDARNITNAQNGDVFICVKDHEYATVGKEYRVYGMSFGHPVLEVDTGSLILDYHYAEYFKRKPDENEGLSESHLALKLIADILKDISEGKEVSACVESSLAKVNGEMQYGDTFTYTFKVKAGYSSDAKEA